MPKDTTSTVITSNLRASFDMHRARFLDNPFPLYADRMDNLSKLDRMIAQNKEALITAINSDFGCRSRTETILAEIVNCHGSVHYARKHLRRWMRPRRRRTSFWSLPAKTYRLAQPLGVVGIMSPWNYALHLAVAPLASALAAGNCAMLCMSEETPTLTALMTDLIAQTFPADQVSVVLAGPETSPEFASLPFDHLLFTGSTRVGKLIAAAAAQNLTPVTLELGGKSPAIVAQDYSVAEAAARIAWGKTVNAGQTCVAPDYVFVPKGNEQEFVDAALAKFTASYSSMNDPDLTAIVSERFFVRVQAMLEEARQGGATILQPDGMTATDTNGVYKIPLTIVLDAPDGCELMQEEIFGPILPVKTYTDLSAVVRYINAHDRPLALYCFTHARDTIQMFQRETVSGTFGVNETVVQYVQEDLAFGGVGASGQGAYHGPEGFDTFSHLKSVFEQRGIGSHTGIKLLHPPYGRLASFILKLMKG